MAVGGRLVLELIDDEEIDGEPWEDRDPVARAEIEAARAAYAAGDYLTIEEFARELGEPLENSPAAAK